MLYTFDWCDTKRIVNHCDFINIVWKAKYLGISLFWLWVWMQHFCSLLKNVTCKNNLIVWILKILRNFLKIHIYIGQAPNVQFCIFKCQSSFNIKMFTFWILGEALPILNPSALLCVSSKINQKEIGSHCQVFRT